MQSMTVVSSTAATIDLRASGTSTTRVARASGMMIQTSSQWPLSQALPQAPPPACIEARAHDRAPQRAVLLGDPVMETSEPLKDFQPEVYHS